jgi:hypothetical protein
MEITRAKLKYVAVAIYARVVYPDINETALEEVISGLRQCSNGHSADWYSV